VLREHGKADVKVEHETTDVDGQKVYVDLRLNLACTTQHIQAWSCSLKLQTIRIDGIDYHTRFLSADGTIARGWHRHGWDPARRIEQTIRLPIQGFDDVKDLHTFVQRLCKLLRIVLSATDYGLFDVSGDS
jgi:hypothetical protein